MSPRKILALVLVVLPLSACTSWQLSGYISPPQYIEEQEPDQVRITTIDDQIVIRNPEVRGDSIVGEDRSVAVSDMRRLEIRRFSALKTVGLASLIYALGYAAVLVSFLLCDDCN